MTAKGHATTEIKTKPSIYLMVGDLYFGNQAKEVKTLLGSCVAVTLWHPTLKVGGMCHIALPENSDSKRGGLNTRYAQGAINSFILYMTNIDTQPREYVARIFGGGQMFHYNEKDAYNDIGAKNISLVKELMEFYKFRVVQDDTSGAFYRHVCLDLSTGVVDMRKMPVSETMG